MTLSQIFCALTLSLTFFNKFKVEAATWNLTTTINPEDFDTKFNYYNQTDPNYGYVLYQSETDAKYNNLTGISNGNYFMRVDTTEVQSEGRRSIRLQSQQSFQDGVYVLNVSHVPIGCASWPAFWTLTTNETNWPIGGEIDILENFNDLYNGPISTLHTENSCIVPKSTETGTLLANNCSAFTTDNSACSVEMNGTSYPTWGNQFNNNGGGIVAMERALGSTGSGVRVWIWTMENAPSDLNSNSESVDPDSWGTPNANFNIANNCHSQFGPHNIIFDIDLCGSAGLRTYNQTSCASKYSNCGYQVGNNGSSFNQSYWSIGSLRIFENGGGTDNAQNSPNTNSENTSTTNFSSRSYFSTPIQIGSFIVLALTGAAILLI